MGYLEGKAAVDFKCSSPSRWTALKATVGGVLSRRLHYLKKQVFTSRSLSKAGKKNVAVQRIPRDWNSPLNKGCGEEACGKGKIDRINSETCPVEVKLEVVEVIQEIDIAINCYLSDSIEEARKNLQYVFQKISETDARSFEYPTRYGWLVLNRGKELFFEGGISSSVKHGTLLLDSSNGGAQFYFGLLNVVGAFAVTISEYEIGKETFSKLISLHRKRDITSHLRDLGAAYNNAGCISLIKGDLNQAEFYFKTSMKNFKSEKFQQLGSSSLEVMLIAVQSNISRLFLMARNFGEAVETQEQVAQSCKATKTNTLPLEVVFTVLNNQAVLHTTLTNFGKAEEALEWLISYCREMNREDCDFLLNFVSLHLCEVLHLAGKSKEAEKVFSSEMLKRVRGTDLAMMFGQLHVNVRAEALEKVIDVLVHRGYVKFACTLLEKSVNNLKKSFGPDHYNVASLLYKQGTILSLIGENLSSVEKFKCSIAILENMFNATHPLLLTCYMSLGDVALRLKRGDESYFYFQRAMENIEVLYQVSFVSQLSRKYVEITKNAKNSRERRLRVDRTESLVEDLVAEHGLAFAVLLSRLVVQHNSCPSERWNIKGKQPLITKSRRGQCSGSMDIISSKCTRDFLQSGQMFVRQGMTKEAAAFFQQAGKYCATNHMIQGPTNPCLARLYSVITNQRLGNQETLDNNRDLINCLEELSEVTTEVITDGSSKRTSDDLAMMTSDCQLNLKLVLIFLILLSIELKMIDTTFAAYDLYSKLSQNDETFLLLLNGGLQVYASRTSITCNGKTAVQDVLVSSTIGTNEDDSECPVPENQLFRSLACKKDVPTDNYLVTYNSAILLDIDDLQALERKISRSVQECFQLKCFETGIEGSATQVVVDLTSKSICDFYDISSTGKHIELLSLCVSQEANADVSHGGNVSEISTAMLQKITCLTFEDEHTSSFIFSRSALSLLQQYNSGEIFTLSVESQCLSMTVFHPVKARVTLWRMDKCIKQKIQFVQSARHRQTGWKVPQQTSCEELVGISTEADRFSWPDIDQWAKAYHVKFLTDDVDCDGPLDVSNAHCGRHKIILDGRQETCVQISSDESEENENLRICLNASVLEGLTVISDISRQLYGNRSQEDDDVTEVDTDSKETSCSPSSYQSQLQNEVIFSSFGATNMDPKAEMESRNSTMEAPDSTSVEEEPWTREENLMAREDDDDDQLGRSLFEKDRQSRRSFMAELQESLKEKETPSKSNFLKPEEVTQNVIDVVIDVKKEGTRDMAKSDKPDNSPTRIAVTLSSFKQPPFDAEAELQTRNLSASGLHDERSREADDENTLEGHFFEKYKHSRSSLTAELKDPPKEEIAYKSNSLGDENSPTCEKKSGKQDSVEDPCYHETRKVESSFLPGASGQMTQEDDEQGIIETSAENVLPKVEEEDATWLNLCQSEKPSSIHDQTQFQQRSSLQEVYRPRTHTATYVEMDSSSPQMEAVKGYTIQERYEKESIESNKVQNEPLRNNAIPKPVSYGNMTKTKTPGLSFEIDDEIVPDGPTNETFTNIQSTVNDSMYLNHQMQSLLFPKNESEMGTLGKSKADDNYSEALQIGTQRTGKSQFIHRHMKETAFLHPFGGFMGGDVIVDGDSSNASCEEDVVDGPVSTNFPKEGKRGSDGGKAFETSLDISKEISGNETTSFPLDNGIDVINDPAHSRNIDTYLIDMPLDFGGARPKERSINTLRKASATKTKMTEPIPAYQYEEMETHGIFPRFLARHTVKSNGAILEAPSQDGFDEPYFSAKAMSRGGKRFNPSTYSSNGSDLGFDAEEAFATRPYTRGDVQSLGVHQKPPLYRKESWHFPPPVADETSAMQSDGYIDQGCVERQHSTHFEGSFISKVKELFSSRESQSTYNEMDSMTNEYHSSIDDNEAVEPPAVSAGQRSATEDSTSSLLGSLQQIMAKTVKLIAVSDTVGKQPQQEPKEIEKVGIQEEARGSRDQEQAVTTVVEDSRNQEESSQENEQTLDNEGQSIPTHERQSIPVQESPRPVCSHYQRRCLVRFPCCEKFYPCHRCHNESEDCSDDQARAINATHIRCTICYHEQAIDEQSQTCGGCKSKMSEYFCPTCKHFTSVDKNPFHCDKCGICRIHRDRSFHCDVCNVCLDKRLQGKHKCRPDSGHDECCICLEDAFSGCQILPCSHKVHKDCAIAMIQNGVRTCPICRHPLFSQPQNSPQ